MYIRIGLAMCTVPALAHLIRPRLVVHHLVLHEHTGQLVVGFDHFLGRLTVHQFWELLEHLVGDVQKEGEELE